MSVLDTQDLIEDILVDEAEKDALRSYDLPTFNFVYIYVYIYILSYDAGIFREELVTFLEEFRQKKNDEGKPLVQFPKNFDQISDAMTRQDIISTDDKTWSKYLLEEKFNQDSQKRFEGGRYRDLLSEPEADARVHRGLAEIHMLDKQISNLNKQAHRLPGSAPRDRGSTLNC
mmetsp:Transcript_19612/g.33007  ORF Transcript_19612/g.33007 Transcript_19612/m.33007 type:complete len:173 (+) Transcript_19612:122-640(+)